MIYMPLFPLLLHKVEPVAKIYLVSAGGSVSIQPPAGDTWIIVNIYHEYDIDLCVSDGTNTLCFDTDTGSGIYANYAFIVTSNHYLVIKNRDTSNARKIGFSGFRLL